MNIPKLDIKRRKIGKLRYAPYVLSCPRCGGELEEIAGHWFCKNGDWPVKDAAGKVNISQKLLYYINGWKSIGGLTAWGVGLAIGGPVGGFLGALGQYVFYGGVGHKILKAGNNLLQKKKGGNAGRDWFDLLKQIVNAVLKFFGLKGGE